MRRHVQSDETLTALAVVLIGTLLPQIPVADALGFAPLPPAFFAFLLPTVLTYLLLVQAVKAQVMRRLLGGNPAR